jgi:hypothetical protein
MQSEDVARRLADAMKYASTQNQEKSEAQEGKTVPIRSGAQSAQSQEHGLIPRAPHLFVVGVLKGVHCDPPALDLTVTSRTKTVTLHSDNYYKIQFTILFPLTGDLKPCDDLESRAAKVEYVESENASDIPSLIAIELHK